MWANKWLEVLRGVLGKVVDSSFEESEFETQSRYYVHF